MCTLSDTTSQADKGQAEAGLAGAQSPTGTPPRMVCGMVLVERIQSNKHDRATSSKGTSLTLMPHDLHCYLLLATQYTLLSAMDLMIKITNQVASCVFLFKSRMSHLDS